MGKNFIIQRIKCVIFLLALSLLYPLKAIKLRDKLLFNKQEKSNKDSNYQIKDTLTDGLLSHKEKDKNAEK